MMLTPVGRWIHCFNIANSCLQHVGGALPHCQHSHSPGRTRGAHQGSSSNERHTGIDEGNLQSVLLCDYLPLKGPMILPHGANPDRMKFSERTGSHVSCVGGGLLQVLQSPCERQSIRWRAEQKNRIVGRCDPVGHHNRIVIDLIASGVLLRHRR
jgi:hypothetical protein